MTDAKFVHLHTHSHYSLLDCTATVESLVESAKSAGMTALALTDHGNMFGAVEFYDVATKAGIKPIVGYEAYVAPESRLIKEGKGIGDAAYHLTLLAKDITGYRNLMRLASTAYTEGFYYRPRIDKEVLSRQCEGIVCLSGCLSGEIAHFLLIDDEDSAREVAAFYRGLFPKGEFFIEIQDHLLADQRRILPGLVRIAKDFGLPLVATNDIHYVNREDAEAHDALLCINTGKLLSDENRMRFQTQEFYFKSESEMRALFPDYGEAVDNTARVAEMCNLKIAFGELHFPRFEPPDGMSPEDYLRVLCEKGFKRRYGEGTPESKARLKKELDTICRMGFASYFLIVSDFVRFAKENDIPVGPGRGSAAGSVVSYCIGITNIDPLKYNLLFERFLDEKRREMPDIDIDFCMEKRDRVIDYVKNKYGHGNVAQIITFGTMAAKGVVRDVGRVLGVSLPEVNRLCGLIPTTLGTTLESAFATEPRLEESCKADQQVARLFEIGRKLEGIARHPSVHAAGVVIADKPLEEYVPLYAADGERITQFPMDILPQVGLLKMDFLGLRTLSIIRRAVDLIEADHGKRIDMDAIPLDDKKTYELLSRGESAGVFQCESSGFRDLLKRLLPDKFTDIIAIEALYRPGPLSGGMVDDFVLRKHGKADIKYAHPLLEPILKETYGVMAFQEQVMQILNQVGGMSMSDSYSCIKAISKKKQDVIEARREAFLKGATANKVDEKIATAIFDLITFFGGYGFNKSHSTAYALISYQTAWLKANYPVEFFAATMTFEMGDTDKLVEFVKDAKRLGIEIMPPHVNEGFADFRPAKNDKGKWGIRYGLAALKGMGDKAVEALVEARSKVGEFRSVFHLAENVDIHQFTKSTLEILIKAGALDCFGAKRSQLAAVAADAIEAAGSAQADMRAGQATFFSAVSGFAEKAGDTKLPDIAELPEPVLAAQEKEVIGFYLTSHPLVDQEAVINRYSNTTVAGLAALPDGAEVTIGGAIAGVKAIVTKKGKNAGEQMARFALETLAGTAPAVMFPNEYRTFRDLIINDRIVILKGRADRSGETPGIRASEVIPIEEADEKLARRMLVELPPGGPVDEAIKRAMGIIKKHPGRVPVFFRLTTPEARVIVQAGAPYCVAVSKGLVDECEAAFGEGHVVFSNGNGGGNGHSAPASGGYSNGRRYANGNR